MAQLEAQLEPPAHSEELRIRRMISDQLHGNLQFRLVAVTAQLDSLAQQVDGLVPPGKECVPTGKESESRPLSQQLRDIAQTVDEIREVEVRALSHAIYPAGIELGLVPALKLMTARLPHHIAATVTVADAAVAEAPVAGMTRPVTVADAVSDALSRLSLTESIVLCGAVEEAVTNALKHGQATSIDIRIGISVGIGSSHQDAGNVLTLTVDDNGCGLPGSPSGERDVASGQAAGPRPWLRTGLGSGHGIGRQMQLVEGIGGSLTVTNRLATGEQVGRRQTAERRTTKQRAANQRTDQQTRDQHLGSHQGSGVRVKITLPLASSISASPTSVPG